MIRSWTKAIWTRAPRLGAAAITCLMLAVPLGAAAIEPWQIAYDLIDVDDFAFEHPMTVINREELQIAKARIARGVYPQAAVFPLLLRDAEEAQRFVADPPEVMEIMAGYAPGTNLPEMREWLWRNRHAAYASALAYAYTGEARYAEKTAEILNAWASKGTRFTGYDRGLQLGSWFSGMLYAADLIYEYEGWEPEERERFTSWWRREVLPHVRAVMLERENNWKDAGILGVLAAAVVLEDRELLREGLIHLHSYFYERTVPGSSSPGVWKIKSDENGVYLPHEVTRNEGRSGVTYTGYALTSAVQALEIARYAGYDLWHAETPEGVTFQDVIEWYFRWDLLRHSFPWHADPNRGPTRKNPYEIANNHYELMPEIREWLRWNRPVNGEQGDEYVTLNKGDMPVSSRERLVVLGGYDGLYTWRRLGEEIEVTLLIDPERETLGPWLRLNLHGAEEVRLAPGGEALPFVPEGSVLAIDLSGIASGEELLRFTVEGARISGVESVRLDAVDGRRLSGPVLLEVELEGAPEPLEVERVELYLDGELLYAGAELPTGLWINQGELDDGFHKVVAKVAPGEGLPVVERAFGFRVNNLTIEAPASAERVAGEVLLRLSTGLRDVQRVMVQLIAGDGRVSEVWNEPRLPGDLTLNTREVADGRYRLEATAVGGMGGLSRAAVEFEVRNEWRLVDPFDPPATLFGIPLDRSLALRATDGWEYASDDPERFFGDAGRRVRRADTAEELVWEAPLLREAFVRLYATEQSVEPWVRLLVSTDGVSWTELEYETQVAGASGDGWYELYLESEVPGDLQVGLFQLRALPTGGRADGIQLGEIELRGWYPE